MYVPASKNEFLNAGVKIGPANNVPPKNTWRNSNLSKNPFATNFDGLIGRGHNFTRVTMGIIVTSIY